MKYILTHTGSKLPTHILHTLRQILFIDPTSKIILCTDQNVVINESRVEIINTNDLNLPEIGSYFIYEQDPLWRNSLQRIFIINEYIKTVESDTFIHFDNDVLIYTDVGNFVNTLPDDIFITQQTADTFIFGYSILKNKTKFNLIADTILKEVELGMSSVLSKTQNHAHEMRLLHCFCEKYITPLPTHPEIFDGQLFFDPITYGQHLGGVNYGPGPGYIDKYHIVGKILEKNETVVSFDGAPFITYNDVTYDLANLHLHGKKLDFFKTYE